MKEFFKKVAAVLFIWAIDILLLPIGMLAMGWFVFTEEGGTIKERVDKGMARFYVLAGFHE